MNVEFTHKGWFGLCPVYFSDIDSDSPIIEPRHIALEPLMIVSELCYEMTFSVIQMFKPDYLPTFALRITGELAEPIVKEVHE